ncbi:hypothetical protein HYH03_013683 [Edaphochlamys debaryana]|uniref:Protein kinase domain-containing protein n=1 Tax=Edaphochlamys debaryana TaxID=47281 RepID=A0A835XP82_9CHLO|nr:hypothetical protein HYH03_013683 [Edaphochlamys debaryana]|eukprot:KAG2487683.1 hypothetical protein HYH03_013683 [Edaphochlamys debaryana]
MPCCPVTPEALVLQSPRELTEDVTLLTPIGAGASGMVWKCLYQGAEAAVKLVVADGQVDKALVSEALVSPQLRHPNVVTSFVTRGAMLTRDFIEQLCGGPQGPAASADPPSPMPHLATRFSQDGLGDPRIARGAEADGTGGWQHVCHRVGALPSRCLLMVVQEYCNQGTLAGAIKRGTFRPRQGHRSEVLARRMLLRTAAEASRGMIHLHCANVVHGDLKPANVLLVGTDRDRRGFVAKIADFGLARLLQSGQSCVDSSSWGTLAYASPESLNGQHSKASDVYSFGIMLWEMVTGERPYEKLMPGQIMLGVSLQGLRPTWPSDWPALAALAARCCAQEPGQRPSFREVERALVEMEEGLWSESRRQSFEALQQHHQQHHQNQHQHQQQHNHPAPGRSLVHSGSLGSSPAAGGCGGGAYGPGNRRPPHRGPILRVPSQPLQPREGAGAPAAASPRLRPATGPGSASNPRSSVHLIDAAGRRQSLDANLAVSVAPTATATATATGASASGPGSFMGGCESPGMFPGSAGRLLVLPEETTPAF